MISMPRFRWMKLKLRRISKQVEASDSVLARYTSLWADVFAWNAKHSAFGETIRSELGMPPLTGTQ